MFEIGDTLREARSRKGLTLRDVEDGTKIRSRYIQALEGDDFEVIPGAAYVKGFLRTYAGFLDLDPDLLVNEYRVRYEHAPEPQKVLTTRPQSQRTRAARGPSRTWLVGLIALVVIAALAWVGWGNRGGGEGGDEPGTCDHHNRRLRPDHGHDRFGHRHHVWSIHHHRPRGGPGEAGPGR